MTEPIISIAPMLDWTTRHFRYFARLLSPNVKLYTEMVTTKALLHAEPARFLQFHADEHPLVLQLGGACPDEFRQCIKLAHQYDFDEVNINVGCPSDRVQNGRFGACLMAEPNTVADCVAAMCETNLLPVTVKTRIGIDHQDSYDELYHFIKTVAQGGCDYFIIHARKAWLNGLSPKENREVPPLNYPRVYQLKQDFPELTFIINGGIKTIADIKTHLNYVDGVMIGREAYHNPFFLTEIESEIFNNINNIKTRHEVLENFYGYVSEQLDSGVKLSHMARHIMGLFQGQAGARAWRRYLSEHIHSKNADLSVLQNAAELVYCQQD